MSEKYYSTLTNDLAKQYRLALAKRFTNYTPEYRSEYSQLKILTSNPILAFSPKPATL